jgi:glycosyltransferase involved in cell wall biosynthesis
MSKIIDKELSSKILMTGDYYKHSHPGGISAVVQYWSDNIEDLQYYPIYRSGGRLTKGWWFVTSYARLFIRLCTDRNIRIVHLHTAADGSFKRNSQLIRMIRRFDKRIILHIHASRFKDFFNESTEKGRHEILKTLDSTDRLIVLSQSWKEWFMSQGIAEDKITILHNITPDPTRIPEARTQDGRLHLLFMGEIGQRKGVFDILRALRDHKEEIAGKLELRIGGNRQEELLMSRIKEYGLENMVIFEGWVSGEKKLRLLNWADVYILPSFNEGLPISILEAMSYGCPIISTPVGGIPEVVNDNGILVRPGESDEIFAAIRRYIDKPQLIRQEGLASLRNVSTYLPDHVMNHLREIYLREIRL